MSELFMEMHQRRARSRLPSAASRRDPEDDAVDEAAEDDPLANVLSLKLRKPKGWKWELSTSRSCSNIALPHILLYDDAGALLVDTDGQPEGVFRQDDLQPPPPPPTTTTTTTTARSPRKPRKAAGRAATANLESAVRRALDREFDGLRIEEATPSTATPTTTSRSSSRRRQSPAAVELFTHELSDFALQRRANSFKGVRFQVDEDEDENVDQEQASFHVVDLPTPPSTVTTTSSSGPREKRRYRRSQSSLARSPATSESILERLSLSRGRFSSPEFAEELERDRDPEQPHGPRYFLRTSKAGTLVVHEESFNRCRRRRRPRHSSSENILNDSSSKSRSTSSLKSPPATGMATATTPAPSPANLRLRLPEEGGGGTGSLTNVAERPRRRAQPVRRYRSDGNVLLHRGRSSSTSSTGSAEAAPGRQLRKYGDYRRQSKRGLVPIDPENGTWHAQERPTAR